MPLVKMIRGGQVTFPKVFRDKFGLKEGDLMEYEIRENGIFFKPKEVIDKTEGKKLWQIVEKMHAKMEGVDPLEIEKAIEESIREVRRSKKTKVPKAKTG